MLLLELELNISFVTHVIIFHCSISHASLILEKMDSCFLASEPI